MRAAIIEQLGELPVCRDVPEPVPGGALEIARVRAAAIKNIERMLAAGTHYASDRLDLPAQIGTDAVVELADGRRVFTGAVPPAGTMAERIVVDRAMAVPVPDDIHDAPAAALPNAGVSAWLALEYTGRLQPGQSVLILGATGVTGALAAQLAKQRFGAAQVVAVGRDAARLRALSARGADQTISIANGVDDLGAAIRSAHAEHRFDLVLDFLWGPPAERTLHALGGDDLAAGYQRTRFVQIGETAGPTVDLNAGVLRSTGVELLGQGGGSIPREAFQRVTTEIIPELFAMLARQDLSIDTVTQPLAEVAEAWVRPVPSGTRTVLIPQQC